MIVVDKLVKIYDRYKRSATKVLKEISLELPDKGFICILGESGCGKTTLMNVMGGLDCFEGGSITVGEVTAKRYGTRAMEKERNHRFGYIFQNYYMLSDRSVLYNVYLGMHSLPLSRREKLVRAKMALESVDMVNYARKKTSDLSGGQQQRVSIARALARQPEIIFADEPTGNLDEANTNQVCKILREIANERLVVMVTHERRIAEQYADRIISLEEGQVCSDIENTPSVTGEEHRFFADIPPEESKKKKNFWNPVNCFKEAIQMLSVKGNRTGWLYTCLLVLMAVIVLTVGDYMTVASIRPEEFQMVDSRIIQVNVTRSGIGGEDLDEAFESYIRHLEEPGYDMLYLPLTTDQTNFHFESAFDQIGKLEEKVQGFTYVPLSKLSGEDLLYGRMPQNSEEVVVDRFVAEKFLKGNGILLGNLHGAEGLLGKKLSVTKKAGNLTIVGISETKNMAIYVDEYMLLAIATGGSSVMNLSELQKRFPGKYDDVFLKEGQIYVTRKAGDVMQETGSKATMSCGLVYETAGQVEEDIYAAYVIRDEDYDTFIRAMMLQKKQFFLYSEEKEKVKEQLVVPEELQGVIQVEVTDRYEEDMKLYQEAVAEKIGARTLITVTLLLISAVMLLFLLKARTQSRMELFTVYRLLGVPKSATIEILFLENLLLSLTAALPSALISWGVVTIMNQLPSLEFSMVLSLKAVLISYGAVLVFHLLAALLPAVKLLRLPAAQLAAKFDF